MKFFTPELIDRFGSPDDDVADAAMDEWEQRSDSYRKHLDTLRQYLPVDFRNLLDRYRLHDAAVVQGLRSSVGDKALYLIELVPEASSEKLTLTYALKGPSPANLNGECYWLYDEVDVVDRHALWVFVHTILLSDGTELRLEFTDFQLAAACARSRE
jgi:hypothetical protein